MKIQIHILFACVLTSACMAATCSAQDQPPVLPTSMGFSLPTISGQVSYAITASQTYTTGYNGQDANVNSTNISGNIAYLSSSETHPFGMIYSGGFLGSESAALPSSTFQNLSLSQLYHGKRDNFVIADTVSYLPQSPISGLSGVAGVGDLGIGPVQIGGYQGPGILTQYSRRVSNDVSASDTHNITGKTSLSVTGFYSIGRFLYTDSLPYNTYDTNEEGATVGVLHRLSARDSFGVNYTYTHFSFVGQSYSFDTHGANVEYIHRFSPRLIFDGSAGPQWNLSDIYSSTPLNAAVTASLVYTAERSTFSVGYTRGASTGFGVVQGSLTDTVGLTARHNFSRSLSAATTFSYSHSASLATGLFLPFSINSEIGSAQVTRSLGTSFSIYASYTAQNQNSDNYLANTIALNGLSQTVGVGITYSPRTRHFRQ
jgi:hypothetical protein